MASEGLLLNLLGGLEDNTKRVLSQLVRAWAPNNKVSAVDHQTKAENFQAYHLVSTTGASTGEFSIEHGMGITPHTLLPTLDLTSSNASLIPLTVTRPADSRRIYLKSSITSAPFSVLVE